MKIPTRDVSSVESWEDLRRWSAQMFKDIGSAINGQIAFGENIQSTRASATFTAANTEVRVSHSLGRVPSGYIVISSSANISVFNGGSANTETDLYVQASGAGTVTLLVI
jgi:hypothetical protein